MRDRKAWNCVKVERGSGGAPHPSHIPMHYCKIPEGIRQIGEGSAEGSWGPLDAAYGVEETKDKLCEGGAESGEEVCHFGPSSDRKFSQGGKFADGGRHPGVVEVSQRLAVGRGAQLERDEGRRALQNREEAIDGALAPLRMSYIVRDVDFDGDEVRQTGSGVREDEVVELADGVHFLQDDRTVSDHVSNGDRAQNRRRE